MARSNADELRAEDDARVESLSAEERIRLARELGERGIRNRSATARHDRVAWNIRERAAASLTFSKSASSADLVLLKLAAGGSKDLIDARELLRLGPRHEIIEHVNENISSLRPGARNVWQNLLVP